MITKVWSSFSVTNLDDARTFYGKILGLDLKEHPMGMLELHLPGDVMHWVYQKESHKPADFTVLNMVVADIEAAVDRLMTLDVRFEQYEAFKTDKKGISRHPGRPAIAWFKDPSGNILALMEGS